MPAESHDRQEELSAPPSSGQRVYSFATILSLRPAGREVLPGGGVPKPLKLVPGGALWAPAAAKPFLLCPRVPDFVPGAGAAWVQLSALATEAQCLALESKNPARKQQVSPPGGTEAAALLPAGKPRKSNSSQQPGEQLAEEKPASPTAFLSPVATTPRRPPSSPFFSTPRERSHSTSPPARRTWTEIHKEFGEHQEINGRISLRKGVEAPPAGTHAQKSAIDELDTPVASQTEQGPSAQMNMDREVLVCSLCSLVCDVGDLPPDWEPGRLGEPQLICVACRADLAVVSQNAPPPPVQAVIPVTRSRKSPELRQAILGALVASERALLAAESIEEWDADFITYSAGNGCRYRVELGSPHRQISLRTGTVRAVYREPAPAAPDIPPWVAIILPGATWQYEAGFRDGEISSTIGFGALNAARRKIAYREPISKALDALHQAGIRAEFPQTEGMVWPE